VMCQWCEQIWHSGEYQLFPIGMHGAEEEVLLGSVFFTLFFTSDNRTEESLSLV